MTITDICPKLIVMDISPKQRQVLALTDGRTIKEIAEALGWPERTVKYHSDALRRKFNVEHRRQLIQLRQRGDLSDG